MDQQSRNAELQALIFLKDAISLRALGCRFERGLGGGVVVTCGGRGLGAWWYQNEQYNFAPMAHGKVQKTARTIDDIIRQTAALTTSHFLYRGRSDHDRLG